jgi:hypothetical protein
MAGVGDQGKQHRLRGPSPRHGDQSTRNNGLNLAGAAAWRVWGALHGTITMSGWQTGQKARLHHVLHRLVRSLVGLKKDSPAVGQQTPSAVGAA